MPLANTKLNTKQFTVDDYQQLAELGFLKASDRIELINGEIVHMVAKGVAHEICITELNEALIPLVKGLAKVRCQSPIALPPINSPEPDFAIVRSRLDRYISGHPKAEDVLLVIEVSDSSIVYDQSTKLALYAEHKLTHYWIFNLLDNILESYCEPYQNNNGKWDYRSRQIHLPGDTITIPGLSEMRSLALTNIFPPTNSVE